MIRSGQSSLKVRASRSAVLISGPLTPNGASSAPAGAVTIVAAGLGGFGPAEEDQLCAELLESLMHRLQHRRHVAAGAHLPHLVPDSSRHLLAPLLEADPPEFPFVALLVSGGHSMLVEVRRIGDYRVLGETLDDAAGEAFDKTAKLLGLGYPGGPRIAQAAEHGDPHRYRFPRPMTDRPGLEFSFSGLKTHTRNLYRKYSGEAGIVEDIAAEGFETSWRVNALGLLLVSKQVIPAMKEKGAGAIVVIGATASRRGMPRTTAFAPAKAAQRSLAEAMARHLWPAGIHVSPVVAH